MCIAFHVKLFLTDEIILEFSRQILEKYCSIKFHENMYSESGVVPSGRTDRQTVRHNVASSRFSKFCELR
jgi:hypothetical protein